MNIIMNDQGILQLNIILEIILQLIDKNLKSAKSNTNLM